MQRPFAKNFSDRIYRMNVINPESRSNLDAGGTGVYAFGGSVGAAAIYRRAP